MPLFLQTSLGGGVGRLKHEALREEMHCFDEHQDMPSVRIEQSLCCSAAMRNCHSSVFRKSVPLNEISLTILKRERPHLERAWTRSKIGRSCRS